MEDSKAEEEVVAVEHPKAIEQIESLPQHEPVSRPTSVQPVQADNEPLEQSEQDEAEQVEVQESEQPAEEQAEEEEEGSEHVQETEPEPEPEPALEAVQEPEPEAEIDVDMAVTSDVEPTTAEGQYTTVEGILTNAHKACRKAQGI